MVSSNSVDELRGLLGPTARQHGLEVAERHLNTFFDQLRLLSDNLAFKLASTAPNQRTEVLGLSPARLYLDYQDVLRDQIVVPLDAHPELYAEARRQARELGDALSFQRSDLAVFHLDARQRTITCRLVEVKCYTALDDLSAYQRLKNKIVHQMERSQTVLTESFDPALHPTDRVDRPVKNLALGSMLRFYLERAARHGTIDRAARTSTHQLLDSLDDGYQLRFTRSGLIFDLARTGTNRETEDGVEFHRIGSDLIDELIQAIPTVRPGLDAVPASDAESPEGSDIFPLADASEARGSATAPTLALLQLSLPRLADAEFRAVPEDPPSDTPEDSTASDIEEESAAEKPEQAEAGIPQTPATEGGHSPSPEHEEHQESELPTPSAGVSPLEREQEERSASRTGAPNTSASPTASSDGLMQRSATVLDPRASRKHRPSTPWDPPRLR
ncbi:hypothetical protein [Streptomyces asiaticus]